MKRRPSLRIFGITLGSIHLLATSPMKELTRTSDYGENSRWMSWRKDQNSSLLKDSWSPIESSLISSTWVLPLTRNTSLTTTLFMIPTPSKTSKCSPTFQSSRSWRNNRKDRTKCWIHQPSVDFTLSMNANTQYLILPRWVLRNNSNSNAQNSKPSRQAVSEPIVEKRLLFISPSLNFWPWRLGPWSYLLSSFRFCCGRRTVIFRLQVSVAWLLSITSSFHFGVLST